MKVAGLFLIGLLAVAAVPMPEGESVLLERGRRGRATPTPAPSNVYQIGVGKADITGPIGGKISGFDVPQTSRTLRSRSFARAFAFYQGSDDPVVFVVAERWIISNFVYNLVLREVSSAFPKITRNNLIISATHTHSASHVWSDYPVLQLSSADYPSGLTDSIYADGLIKAIKDALTMASTTTGNIKHFTLDDANDPKIAIQRSHSAFEKNDQSVKDALSNEEIDPRMTFLRFDKSDGTPLGLINWFNVQGTSMKQNSKDLTAGNKGVAAKLFERAMADAGHSDFVAAFANGGFGDASPNVAGPKCTDSGNACDFGNTEVTYHESTKVVTFTTPTDNCGGNYQKCQADGPLADAITDPALNMIETGTRQFSKAKSVWDDAGTAWKTVSGDIESATKYFNIRTAEPACGAAVGFSYLSGTIDGTVLDTRVLNLGAAEAMDNMPTDSSLDTELIREAIDLVSDLVVGGYDQATKDCQAPKHILGGENVGNITFFGGLASTSIISIGDGEDSIVIGGVPVAPTAASAYLMETEIKKATGDHRRVVISSPTNDYLGYATTEQEYQAQRFEGAATVYGPKTANKIAIKLKETYTCMEANNCDAHKDFNAAECVASPPADNCPPFFDELAASKLNGAAHTGLDFAKQHGMDFSDAGFEQLQDDKRSTYVDGTLQSANNQASAKFYVSGKWTRDNVGKRFCEVQCKKYRNFDTVFTDEDHEMYSYFSQSDNDLVAKVSWSAPEGFNSGGSTYKKCKIVVRTYGADGNDEKEGESPEFDAPEH